jgi:hypothetical protein
MTTKIRSHRLARLVAVSLTAAALVAPAASARPAPLDPPVVIAPEPAPVITVDNGFDWDSAAVGAGGAGALLLLVSLGGFTYRSRHHDVGILR